MILKRSRYSPVTVPLQLQCTVTHRRPPLPTITLPSLTVPHRPSPSLTVPHRSSPFLTVPDPPLPLQDFLFDIFHCNFDLHK